MCRHARRAAASCAGAEAPGSACCGSWPKPFPVNREPGSARGRHLTILTCAHRAGAGCEPAEADTTICLHPGPAGRLFFQAVRLNHHPRCGRPRSRPGVRAMERRGRLAGLAGAPGRSRRRRLAGRESAPWNGVDAWQGWLGRQAEAAGGDWRVGSPRRGNDVDAWQGWLGRRAEAAGDDWRAGSPRRGTTWTPGRVDWGARRSRRRRLAGGRARGTASGGFARESASWSKCST